MSETIEVSVVIPTYNEEKYIKNCIKSLVNQTFPKEKYEILIIDGMSKDKTRDIVTNIIKKYKDHNIKLINNLEKITPVALNKGIETSKGDIIITLGAHSIVQKDFIYKNIKTINRLDENVMCVGGKIETINENKLGEIISLGMSSPFGVGDAVFRYAKQSAFVDTVAFGAYKKNIFDIVGNFDKNLIKGQDYELNYRIIKRGYKIFMNTNIKTLYYSRNNFKKLWTQYFGYGYWKVKAINKHKSSSSLRHFIPFIFVNSIFLSIALSFISKIFIYLLFFILSIYLTTNLIFSIKIGLKNKKYDFFKIILTFFVLHFSYGIGFSFGLLNLIKTKMSSFLFK